MSTVHFLLMLLLMSETTDHTVIMNMQVID